jgi:hypothetical protein
MTESTWVFFMVCRIIDTSERRNKLKYKLYRINRQNKRRISGTPNFILFFSFSGSVPINGACT